MGQLLHGCARTTAAIRLVLQRSEESIMVLAKRYHLNPKTVQKWKQRNHTDDVPMGPKYRRSTVLSTAEEAIIVAFRRYSLLSLDDCLYALQPNIPHLTRSSLHRCFQRHGIHCLPKDPQKSSQKKIFKKYPIGYFHIDIAEVATQKGKLQLFVAIDRTSKWAYVELHSDKTRKTATEFLAHLIDQVPYRIHTILTDNGIQFIHRKKDRMAFPHAFQKLCQKHEIDHRLTKINHPWTNGQVERMNRTIKEATVKRYYYHSHKQLEKHLHLFLNTYNFAKRLKALKGLTPYETIIKCWNKNPEHFHQKPNHYTLGLNTAKVPQGNGWGRFVRKGVT